MCFRTNRQLHVHVSTCTYKTIFEAFCNPHSVTTYTMYMYKESHSTCRLSTGHVQTCTNCITHLHSEEVLSVHSPGIQHLSTMLHSVSSLLPQSQSSSSSTIWLPQNEAESIFKKEISIYMYMSWFHTKGGGAEISHIHDCTCTIYMS